MICFLKKLTLMHKLRTISKDLNDWNKVEVKIDKLEYNINTFKYN